MSWDRYERRDYLAPQDMPNPDGPNIVQIAGVDSLEKTFQGKTETIHVLRLAGWKRYLKLNNTRIQVLKALFGPEESSAFGRNITLQVQAVTIYGEVKPDVCIAINHPPANLAAIDQTGRPLHAGQMQGAAVSSAGTHALPGAGAVQAPTFDKRPIGQERWDRFAQLMVSTRKTWDQFLAWCKQTHPDMLQHVFGVEFAEVPVGATPVMRLWIEECMAAGKADPKQIPGVTTAAALANQQQFAAGVQAVTQTTAAQPAQAAAPATDAASAQPQASKNIPGVKPPPRQRHAPDAVLDESTDDFPVPF